MRANSFYLCSLFVLCMSPSHNDALLMAFPVKARHPSDIALVNAKVELWYHRHEGWQLLFSPRLNSARCTWRKCERVQSVEPFPPFHVIKTIHSDPRPFGCHHLQHKKGVCGSMEVGPFFFYHCVCPPLPSNNNWKCFCFLVLSSLACNYIST